MYPTSDLASPLFTALWNLVLCGAVRSKSTTPFPLNAAWVDHVQAHIENLEAFRDTLADGAAFPPAVAEMVFENWDPPKALSGAPMGEREVEIAVAAALNEPVVSKGTESLSNRSNRAAQRQLVCLFEALLLLEHSASLNGMDWKPGTFERLLWLAQGLSGRPAVFEGDDEESLPSRVASEYQLNGLLSLDETVRSWAEGRIAELRSATGNSPSL